MEVSNTLLLWCILQKSFKEIDP